MFQYSHDTSAGKCKSGWHCKESKECPAFMEEQSKLDALTALTPKWLQLVSKLTELKCDGKGNGVCCKFIKNLLTKF